MQCDDGKRGRCSASPAWLASIYIDKRSFLFTPTGSAALHLVPWEAHLYFLTLFLPHVRPAYKIVSSYLRCEHTHMVAVSARERTPKLSEKGGLEGLRPSK
jgi:hypothetical protein